MTADERRDARVGGVVLLGLALAVAALLLVEGRHLRPGIHLAVELDRIGNLQAGSDVKLAGLRLGSVDDIQLVPAPPGSGDPAHALLHVWIDARRRSLVRETTDFFVNQEGLLGDAYLGLAERPGEPGPPLADGARVRGVAPPQIDKLLSTSYRNLMAATQLLREGIPEIDLLKGELDTLQRNLDELPSAGPLWSAGGRLLGEARTLSADVHVGGVAARARELYDHEQRRLAPLGPRLRRLADSADRLVSRLGDPRAQRLVAALHRAAIIAERAEQAIDTARALIAMVARGQGSLGAFLQDVELADEMKEMTKTMKRQPWVTIGRPPSR